MPITPYATLDQLKSRLSITDSSKDAQLTDILAESTAYIDSYTRRTWQNAVSETDELHRIGNSGVFYLKNMDVQDISSLKVGYLSDNSSFQEVAAGSYSWEPIGRISILSTPLSTFSIVLGRTPDYCAKVSYTHGKTTVPADIELACLLIAAGTYRNPTGTATGAVKSESYGGGYSVQYSEGVTATSSGTAPEVASILNGYRKL